MDIPNELNVLSAVVSKIWKHNCETGIPSPVNHGVGNPSHYSDGDLKLIEVLIR